MFNTGVYCILNTVNGKRYIGSTCVSFKQRMRNHRAGLVSRKHNNPHLRSAYLKYGSHAFKFIVLVRCAKEDCLTQEQKMIDHYSSADRRFGYNVLPKAGNSSGYKHDQRVIDAGRTRRLGKRLSKITKAKISKSLAGRILTKDHRDKIAAALKGKPKSEQTKKKLRAATKRQIAEGRVVHRKGWYQTDEMKKYLSDVQKNIPKSEETKRRMRKAMKASWKRRKELCA